MKQTVIEHNDHPKEVLGIFMANDQGSLEPAIEAAFVKYKMLCVMLRQGIAEGFLVCGIHG